MASMSSQDINSGSQDSFSYKNATQEEVMEDLTSRFILNLPDHELASLERVCFQVEQAHWFYEDFIREQNPKFPSLPLKKFSAMFFRACPLLAHWSDDHEQAFSNFMSYKTKVPVCGAIMLNQTWDKCVLVKGWKASSGWGFPKGKINEDEPPHSCAIREVLEETGYNLVGKVIPDDVIELTIQGQRISLFIVPGIPEDYAFKTKTRKEISKIEWFRLSELPTWKRNKSNAGRFYLITPFIGPLKAFISARKPRKSHRMRSHEEEDFSASGLESDSYNEPVNSAQSEVEESPALLEAHAASEQGNVPLDPHFAQLLSGLAISANAIKPHNQHRDFLSAMTEKDELLNHSYLSRTTPKLAPKPAPHPSQEETYCPSSETSSGQPPLVPEGHVLRPMDFSSGGVSSLKPWGPTSPILPLVHPPLPSTQPHMAPLRGASVLGPIPLISQAIQPTRSPSSTAGSLKHIAVLEHISKESARMMESFKISQNLATGRTGPNNGEPSEIEPVPASSYQLPRMTSPPGPFRLPTMSPSGPISFPSSTPAPPAAPYPIYPISPEMLGNNFNFLHHPNIPNSNPPTTFTQITPYTSSPVNTSYSPMLSRPFSAAAAPPPVNIFQLGTSHSHQVASGGPGENTLLSILNRPRYNSQISRTGP